MDAIPTSADIVIVGAGTAGCVLASRLSAEPDLSVVILEAGEDRSDDPRTYTPARSRELLGNPDFDWDYTTEPEAELTSMAQNDSMEPGRRIQHPRGKVVGGTSAINSFALIYPSAAEIDAWAALGNDGWAWEDLRPCFRRFQTLVPPDQSVVEKLNLSQNFAAGTGDGPIQASFPRTVTPLHRAWLDGWRGLGMENDQDPLEGKAVGGGITACHIHGKKRERSHAGVAYLTPEVRSRPNLRIVTGALVRRIKFKEGEDGAVAVTTGLVYEVSGQTYGIDVKREVILAAGVFGSPQLLELSGIGDAELLRKHGISVVYNNPAIGENLQDHIRGGITFEAADDIAGLQPAMSPEEAEKLYRECRAGPWAEMAAYMFAYMPLLPFSSADQIKASCRQHSHRSSDASQLSPYEKQHRDFVQKELLSASEATATTFLTRIPTALSPTPGLETGKCFGFAAMLSHPLSHGSTHITSSSPTTKPSIKFNYYSQPLDLEIHARHLLGLEQLAATPPLKALLKPNGVRYPAQPLTLETAKEYLRAETRTNYHPCGTCAMLPEEVGGVVDSRLRVYGTGNVRVVDASVFPMVTRGNVIATVYAVAERAADLVLQDLVGR